MQDSQLFENRFFLRNELSDLPRAIHDEIHSRSTVGMIFGGLLMALGFYACYRFLAATVAAVYLLGGMLIVAGVFYGITAFSARKWTSALLDVFACALYVIAGIATFRQPLVTAGVVSIVIATLFLFQGISRIVAAIAMRPSQWGWLLFNGIVTVFLGGIIFRQWPASSLWLLGTLVGVDMILGGWTMLMTGATLRRFTRNERPTTPGRLQSTPA